MFTLKTPLRTLAALDSLNRLVLSNDSRARRMSRSHFAYRARHGMRSHAWRSVISWDASLAEDLFARGGRCAARASGLEGYRAEAERRACEANLSRGAPLAARYTADIVNRSGKWSKRLAEPCQRNRITSTGRPRLSESPVPVASRLQRHCWKFHQCVK